MKLIEITVTKPNDVSPTTEDRKDIVMEESTRKPVQFDPSRTPTTSAISYILEENEDDSDRKEDEDETQSIDCEEAGIEVVELDKGEGKDQDEDDALLEPTYMLPSFDDVEEIEAYHHGGHHPVKSETELEANTKSSTSLAMADLELFGLLETPKSNVLWLSRLSWPDLLLMP
jgi:hypothetical protein